MREQTPRTNLSPGGSGWAGLGAPPGFRQPGFAGKAIQPSLTDPKIRTATEKLDAMFIAGPRNSIGGAANQFNARTAFEIAGEAQKQYRELARAGVQSYGSGKDLYWALMETLRTVSARGFAFGAMFGAPQQVARANQVFVSDFFEAGFDQQMEREPGIFRPIFRCHVGFFCAADRKHPPRAYSGFADIVSEFCHQVETTRPQLASEVGTVVRSLPARLFSGRGAELSERADMLRRLDADGARLLERSRQK